MRLFEKISLFVLVVCLLAISVTSANLNRDISVEVKIDGDLISQDQVNRVAFQRGDIVEVEIRLNSSINLSDVEIMAIVAGYEFNNIEPMSDSSTIFDVESGVTYKKTLSIRIPTEVDEDNYKLRIIIADRYSTSAIYDYNLKIDSPRHGFQVKDVVFSPGTVIQAGRVLLSTVRVENMGEKAEESVKVTVSIPELGVSASDFIDKIDYEDSETSEEMYLRIPPCANAGDYNAVIEVKFNDLREAIFENAIITVIEGDACEIPAAAGEGNADKPQTVIALGTTAQNVVKGEAGALYPLTVTNNAGSAKAFTVSVEGTNNFASVQINPVSTFILNKDESQAVFLYMTPLDTASAGQHVFTVTVKSGEQVLKQIPLSVTIEEGEKKAAASAATNLDMRSALEIGLVVLVVVLVLLAIIVGLKKLKGDEDDGEEQDEEVEGKTYY